jgi:hypothetical protein
MTRLAAVLAVFVVLASSRVVAAPCEGFEDVDDASAFCVNVAWMKNRGITLGVTPTSFAPDSPVTRLQMAAFMYRLGFQNAFLHGGSAFGTTALLGTTDETALQIIVAGREAFRIEPDFSSPRITAGHPTNFVALGASGGTVSGGGGESPADDCTQSTECANAVLDDYGTVAGGEGNQVGPIAEYGTVSGGLSNRAGGGWASVGGGQINLASGLHATVPGGFGNLATGAASFAAGRGSKAHGQHAVAMGYHAIAQYNGCIVFGDDSTTDDVFCSNLNQFVARSKGGFYLYTGGNVTTGYTGAVLASGTSAWGVASDRGGKEEIVPVDSAEVLAKVAAMPLSTWQWKTETGAVRHMGPMAQDFHAAFGLGDSDRRIVTVDADGVALAAIQGLNAKLESKVAEQDAQIERLRHSNEDLRRSVERLLARMRPGDVARLD